MTPQLPQVRGSRLVDDVRRSLEDAILSGKMQPGQRLAETWIAEQLQVSRTTVREALLMLERAGHVVSIPRRGTYVVRLSQADAFDLGLVRALLEGFAVCVACRNPDEMLIVQMRAYVEDMRACHLPDDLPRLTQIDLAFHKLLVERAGSPRIVELFSSLDGQIGALYVRAIEKYHPDSSQVADTHGKLVDSISTWDAAAAQRAVIDHYLSDQLEQSEAAIASVTAALLRHLDTPAG